MTSTVINKQTITDQIYNVISNIIPPDTLRQTHIESTFTRIKNGVLIFQSLEP
ncbi:hypothetical protein NF27_HJ00440 [Candidatus Jidaibacter acanthamoeba]|uniref:Uncharacterized protein n=1 Tax=Candidatus Jidaibacter acanthamoebae TaxID=86105 RepID=A0A0C1MXH5_9RICK|nr:hypothetical protein [Candidatus Jidaibacter acanthamoeba]KIE04591.1 hypothetical protein NF27_HJ00440 [Candidatus Jidaibacter acanthamoeba]